MGRATQAEMTKRRRAVRHCRLLGMNREQILAETNKAGKKLIRAEQYNHDMKTIHTEWLQADKEWFVRSHLSRIEAVERYELDLVVLNQLEKDPKLALGERLGCIRMKAYLIEKVHSLNCQLDPDMYIKNAVKNFGAAIPEEQGIPAQ